MRKTLALIGVMGLMPALAAGFSISLGGRLASEPSGDFRINYEAEVSPGMTVGLNSRFRLRGLVRQGSTDPFPSNRYLSGDVQASPYIQFSQRIQMDGWRLEPYQRLEATVGTYLISQNPSGPFYTLSADIGAKQRFSLDRTARLTNDIKLGLDRWAVFNEFIANAFVVADELRMDFALGFVAPYVRGSIEYFPFVTSDRLVFAANGGANFNFSSDLEGQLEAGFKSNDAPYLQARLTYRLP